MDCGRKADAGFFRTLLNNLFEASKCTPHHKQYIGGINLYKVLIGVFSTALGGHRGNRTLDHLEQRLLDTLARNITGNRWVIPFARDFVYLVDKYNGPLRFIYIVLAGLQ